MGSSDQIDCKKGKFGKKTNSEARDDAHCCGLRENAGLGKDSTRTGAYLPSSSLTSCHDVLVRNFLALLYEWVVFGKIYQGGL